MTSREFDPTLISKLESPQRYKHFPPEEILAKLGIEDGKKILDLGAGSGYFTFPAARNQTNTVYALDIEPKMIEILQKHIEKNKQKNVQLIQAPVENIPLEDAQIDYVIASMVLHKLASFEDGLQEIYRILKPGGRCICLEWQKRETEQGPPIDQRIDFPVMKQAIKKSGFQKMDASFPSGTVYFITFEK